MRNSCRVVASWILASVAVLAAPPLTTIQDVLYKADGSRFDGVAFIQWRSFQAADLSNVATQSVTVQIVEGVIRVQLAATTTATAGAYYSVRYYSDGRIQFSEIWAVPPATAVLKLSDVRSAGGGVVIPPPGQTDIQESDVVGLIDDLEARPLKGPGYAPSRTAYITESGMLEAVGGDLSDCVRVDGTAGPCDVVVNQGPGFVDGEIPSGPINGVNTVFTLANLPSPPASLALYRNGLLLKDDMDYTLSGNVISFASAAAPQTGDALACSYRLADNSNPTGEAGGALAGSYPNPNLAAGVVSDLNISDTARIREAKLALRFPTHLNSNDPATEEKAALAGTSGAPSATNRYVTDQDSRMTSARPPQAHALLGTGHGDTTPGSAVRGDLITAAGSSQVTWTRLPIGAAGRCLMSNGLDASWNTCVFTGFQQGSLPFADAGGNLVENNSRLKWDNSNRMLSVGNNLSQATVYVYDSQPSTGVTGLVVRGGQGQSSTPLQTWLGPIGTELARVDPAGNISGASFRATTSASRAAWGDAGAASDPSPYVSGDTWYNSTAQTRRSVEGGQVHSLPQVLCGSTGSGNSSTSIARLGSCAIPANLLKPGDRVELQFSYSHEGAQAGFTFEIHWGGTTIVSRDGGAGDAYVSGRIDFGAHSGGAQWNLQSWGNALSLASAVGNAPDSLGSAVVIDLLGRMASSTTDTVTLRNFTVVRYPAQSNP
jgi:hypothetical protein